MKLSAPTSSPPRAGTTSDREESIRHLSPAARVAFDQFLATGDAAKLDIVVLAILEDFIPRTPMVPLAELPGTTLLIDNLGFDSLAITEVVFFTEDLLGIKISNQEIMLVRTLDDLRGFIRRKVVDRPNR